jgi:hypothetical protein
MLFAPAGRLRKLNSLITSWLNTELKGSLKRASGKIEAGKIVAVLQVFSSLKIL